MGVASRVLKFGGLARKVIESARSRLVLTGSLYLLGKISAWSYNNYVSGIRIAGLIILD
jgi:hypothetical protein